MGRPPKKDHEKLSQEVRTAVDPETQQALDRLKARTGLGEAKLLREALIKYLRDAGELPET